eukprot:gene30685-37938_t
MSGSGVIAMHYLGMAAATFYYDPSVHFTKEKMESYISADSAFHISF